MRQKASPRLGAEEQEGFNAFAREHYRDMMIEALRVVKTLWALDLLEQKGEEMPVALAVFEKLATPRVFLIERWHDLDPKERMAYYPDRKELEEKVRVISAQAQGMMAK